MFKHTGTFIKSLVVAGICTVVASIVALGAVPQGPRHEVAEVVRNAHERMRQQVAEYEQRLGQLDYAHARHPASYKGMTETINNNYRGHYTAVNRIANESNARISHLRGPSPEGKRNGIRDIDAARRSEINVLQRHRTAALERLNRERRGRPTK